MRKIQEILRLKYGHGLRNRDIAHSTAKSRSTVADYLPRAGAAGISWPLPEGMDEEKVERCCFPRQQDAPAATVRSDWAEVHRELRRKGVTFALLLYEYKQKNPAFTFLGGVAAAVVPLGKQGMFIMIRRSIPPIRIWQTITGWLFCRPE